MGKKQYWGRSEGLVRKNKEAQGRRSQAKNFVKRGGGSVVANGSEGQKGKKQG